MQLIKKSDIPKVRKRLNPFISFTYEKYLKTINPQKLPEDYLSKIELINSTYHQYTKSNFEGYCLGVFILELSFIYKNELIKNNYKKDIVPRLNDGIDGLIKALEAYKTNPYNVEQVTIKTKNTDNFLIDNKTHPKKLIKDPTGHYYNIEGRFAIDQLFKLISNDEVIDNLNKIKVNNNDKVNYKYVNYFKKYIGILFPYINQYFSHLKSNRERYFLAADLLLLIEIKPKFKDFDSLKDNPKELKKKMINITKQYVK